MSLKTLTQPVATLFTSKLVNELDMNWILVIFYQKHLKKKSNHDSPIENITLIGAEPHLMMDEPALY